MGNLLEVLYDHDIVLDWPAYPLRDDRGLRLTVVGTSRAIGEASTGPREDDSPGC